MSAWFVIHLENKLAAELCQSYRKTPSDATLPRTFGAVDGQKQRSCRLGQIIQRPMPSPDIKTGSRSLSFGVARNHLSRRPANPDKLKRPDINRRLAALLTFVCNPIFKLWHSFRHPPASTPCRFPARTDRTILPFKPECRSARNASHGCFDFLRAESGIDPLWSRRCRGMIRHRHREKPSVKRV